MFLGAIQKIKVAHLYGLRYIEVLFLNSSLSNGRNKEYLIALFKQ